MSIDPNSADVTDVLGASGECPVITVGEGERAKAWRIGWPDGKAKTRLRKLLIGIAEENILEASRDLSPGFQKQLLKDFSEAVRNGDYKTWGPGWLAAYNTPRGQLMFLLSLLQGEHPNATEADATMLFRDKGDAVTVALLCVAPPFFSLLLDEMEQLQTATPEAVLAFKREMIGSMMTAVRKALAKSAESPPPTHSTPTEAK